MRAPCGCLIEDGMVLHNFDGPCAIPGPPEPTDEDYCASAGHKYYGDDGGRGRCYCGAREYPPDAEVLCVTPRADYDALLDALGLPGLPPREGLAAAVDRVRELLAAGDDVASGCPVRRVPASVGTHCAASPTEPEAQP